MSGVSDIAQCRTLRCSARGCWALSSQLPSSLASCRARFLGWAFWVTLFGELVLSERAQLCMWGLLRGSSPGRVRCVVLGMDRTGADAGRDASEVDDEIAASEFLCLVRESSEGLASILMERVRALARQP